MATQIQHRRGTTAAHATFTGAVGEITVDTTKDVVVVHDGSTAGGIPGATEAAVALKAPIDSPTFTGTPTAPTAAPGTNTTQIATTAFVAAAASSGVSDGDKGDVTVSGGGAAWTIDANAVTLAKLVDATATSRVLGRKTAGAGDFEELTASEVVDFIGSTRGSVLYRGAAGWSALTPGTSGHVLTSGGAGADPSYQAAGGGSPGGSSGQVQYNNASAFGGASSMSIDASGNPVLAASTPTTPSAGTVSLYGDAFAGRQLPGFKSPSGWALPLQPYLGATQWIAWVPNSGNNSVTVVGTSTPGTLGTTTTRAAAAGSFFTTCRRTSYVSAAGAGSGASIRSSSSAWIMGSGSGSGGFTFVGRFGIGDAAAVADAMMFVGLYNSGSVGSTTPSNLSHAVGVGCDNADTTLSMFHNDGAGVATKISLGANFPSNTQSTDVYELLLHSSAYDTTVGYRVTRLNTGDVATGTLSTNLPSNALYPQFHRHNGATALAVDLAFMGLYMESQ